MGDLLSAIHRDVKVMSRSWSPDSIQMERIDMWSERCARTAERAASDQVHWHTAQLTAHKKDAVRARALLVAGGQRALPFRLRLEVQLKLDRLATANTGSQGREGG